MLFLGRIVGCIISRGLEWMFSASSREALMDRKAKGSRTRRASTINVIHWIQLDQRCCRQNTAERAWKLQKQTINIVARNKSSQ